MSLALLDNDIRAEAWQQWHACQSLLDFICYTKPDFQVKPYHHTIAEYLERWIEGDITRLIINLPPRHGKTEEAERRLSAYILGLYPDAQIIDTAYSAPLARKTNRDVQNIIVSPEYQRLFPETQLSDEFVRYQYGFKTIRTTDEFEIVGHRGSYRSAGIGGGITGFGANFIIVGDPIKNRKEAYSYTYREAVWSEFNTTLLSRLEPFLGVRGRVLIPATRWHDDDLAGRCIDRQKGEGWVVLNFPAIAPSEPASYDKRRPGEVLWDERFPKKELLAIREALGGYDYAALYEGSPQVAQGTIFKREWFTGRTYKAIPAGLRIIQSLDTAFEEKRENDYSVILTWGITPTHYLLLDIWRGKVEYPELVMQSKAAADKWHPSHILIERKASGHSLLQSLRRDTKLPVIPIDPGPSKTIRAHSCTGLFEAGRVLLPESAPRLYDYLEEMFMFPAGKHDDQVDATTQFLNWANRQSGTYSRLAA